MAQKSALEIVFGTASFDRKPPGLGDVKEIQLIFDEFKSHGHKVIDTARIYGDSEELIGEVGHTGQGLVVDTKINSFFPGALNTENFNKSLKESLTALKTNKVRVLYLHGPEKSTPIEETLAAINSAYKNGHFEELGLSNFSPEDVDQIVQISKEKGYVLPTVYQGLYNLLVRGGESTLFPILRKHGIRFYAYSVLAGSFLTEEVSKESETKGTRFDPTWHVGKMYRDRFWKDDHFEALEKLKASAKKHNITIQELALRWAIHHSALKREHNDAIILGGKTLGRIKQSLDIAEQPALSGDVVKVVDEVWEIVKGNAAAYHH